MKKKTAFLIISFVLALSSLSGCGKEVKDYSEEFEDENVQDLDEVLNGGWKWQNE